MNVNSGFSGYVCRWVGFAIETATAILERAGFGSASGII